MVIDHGSEEIISCCDGVDVTCEVKVDVLHRDDLGVSAARRAAFDAEDRAQ